jgi:hypothetical protein
MFYERLVALRRNAGVIQAKGSPRSLTLWPGNPHLPGEGRALQIEM